MKRTMNNRPSVCNLLSLVLAVSLALPSPSFAASIALATAPLANATTTTVLPNLMFLMDNSGSMGQEHTPDWVMEYNMRNAPWTYDGNWNSPATNQKNCRDSADDDGVINTALSAMDMCVIGDVPFTTSAINSQYYNPEIRYLPGVNADGSSMPSQTDPTAVLLDGYNKHNQTQLGVTGTTINLTTSYPDRVWCTTQTPTAAQLIDTAVCRKNSDYLYPNATFKYGRDNNGTTANKNVLGVYGAPYYYSPVVTEHCSEANLLNCVNSSTPTGVYTFPAKARWCSDTNLTICQAIKTSAYPYPRYPGKSVTAAAASGSITLTSKTAGVGTNGKNVSSITTGTPAIEILGATISGAAGMSSSTLASNIATQINTFTSSPEFTAVAAGDVITITSTAAAGATANGTVSISTTTSSPVGSKVDTTGGVTGVSSLPYTFARTDIIAPVAPDVGSYPKAATRTDCGTTADTTCTYAEEITNFGNWYAYYRTRMQSMKSSVSIAFKPIGSNYRVGFMNICKGDYLPVAGFDNSTEAIPSVAAVGSITLAAAAATTGKSVSSITVGAVEILGATISGGAAISSNALATLIANQINTFSSTPEFTATAAGNVVTFRSTTAAGATANGTVSTVKTSSTIASKVNAAGGVTGVGQKTYWYTKLFSQTASGCGTPLRNALATVGRIFAGKEMSTAGSTSGTTIDPMQYSCQQNFTLLTTDGYWNGAGGTDLSATAMGNLDGGSTPRPMFEGPTASSGTLADVSKYYYDTDLRNGTLTNCTGSLGVDVCEDNVFISSTDSNVKQHMTTFTLGLGVDGTVTYTSDYRSIIKDDPSATPPKIYPAPTGPGLDYYKLLNGYGVNWPVPVGDTETAVDDLWHAAVNGQGAYFSAKDPAQLATGLNAALSAIGSKIGAASAAATSTLNPVPGDNNTYVASYSTVKWQGNLEERAVNVDTGVVSETATWCVENVAGGSCAAPSTVVADSSGSSTIYNCVTPSATAASCPSPGVLVGTDCKVEMPVACSGTMPGKVSTLSDTRTIYKANSSGVLENFVYANVTPTDFDATGLSQWSVLTATQKTAAAGANLVNYLRGQTGYEDRTSNAVDNRLYRVREATLGDALESQPFFISKPVFSYSDPGYAAYKTAQASRAGTVFMGANDGMLHAFAADTGVERWAYVPTAVIPNMWKLADKNYSTAHTNFVNGSPIITDICTANCTCDDACVLGGGAAPTWKTILVSGLNAGGRSYFALDITNPTTPSLLWEITPSSSEFANLGFSYGQPIITKKADGTWVVLVTSGYNNTSPGDGKGYLYVLNAVTGAKISEIATGVGDTTTPSGLAKVAPWNDFGGTNNTTGYLYGGDVLGNLWRFDINAGTSMLFATLKDSLGNAQAVTITPTLGQIKGKRVVFVGTGKYLEVADLTDTAQQTLYAIADDVPATTTTLANARSALVAQTMTTSGSTRTGSNNAVDFASGRGWYVDLAEIIPPATSPSFVGERVNIDMRLISGTLILATIVPSNTVCSPGGHGWLNFFNYETGGYVGPLTLVSTKYDSPIVGINVLYIGGKPIVEVVTASKPTPEIDPSVQIKTGGSAFTGKRVIWRELIP